MINVLFRKIFPLFFLFLLCQKSFSKKVELKYARQVAYNFYNNIKNNNQKSVSINPYKITESFIYQYGQDTVNYIFNFADTGFVIVSANDIVQPILGYSTESFYQPANQPSAFTEWLNYYGNQISYATNNNVLQTQTVAEQWINFFNNDFSFSDKTKGSTAVAPLTHSKWDQTQFYNDRCPVDAQGPGGHTLVGCVATAMGQVMNYYKYPPRGNSSFTYRTSYGRLTANFGQTLYNFKNMPDQLTSASPDVAMLLSHCGIAVQMIYGASSSATSQNYAQYAFINYFKYSSAAKNIAKSNMSDATWTDSIKKNLDLKRPVMYGGFPLSADSSGHSFICDGYDANNYFHFNFGWSGYYNGYFLLTQITPAGLNFSYTQMALINIFPDTKNGYPAYCTNDTTALTGNAGSIYDGSGPFNDYKNNSYCTWYIHPPTTNQNIILTFDEFNTEANKDIVTIYNGSSTTDSVLAKFSGSTIPKNIESVGNNMLIVFTSNDSITGSGFHANYSLSDPIYCQGIVNLTAASDTISNGSGSNNYSNNSSCKWLIKPTSATSITLHFTKFNTEALNDKLKVIDNITNTVISTLSGTQIPSDITINTSQVLLIFTSNSSVTAPGWEVIYYVNSAGIKENNFIPGLKIFPNPANNILNISYQTDNKISSLEIDLLDMTGRLISTYNIENITGVFNKQIDVNQLSKGLYTLRMRSVNNDKISSGYIPFIKE